jgi:hypothetical protein
MAKFFGVIGYGEPEQSAPGVSSDVITEKQYYGDVIRNSRQLQETDKVNNDLTVGNSISIVADAYANEHFFAIRYIKWAGVLWTVSDVEVQSPRLLLRLGGVYNGPTAAVEEGTTPVTP